jgi:hypothetical protein
VTRVFLNQVLDEASTPHDGGPGAVRVVGVYVWTLRQVNLKHASHATGRRARSRRPVL